MTIRYEWALGQFYHNSNLFRDIVDRGAEMFSRDLNVRLSVVYAEIWLDVQRVDLFEDIERTMSGVVDYSTGHIYNIGKQLV
ncbi:hypothetical protein TELCIR_21310 [Teladorsagia circumcincta]|uniref:Peptidase M12B domain-containing protein n=1 Tax=Teladorsagia circumcincta TaxID=45464 RepID=A0A2G9TH38_TELCI|nr:hypothetical protein TELCIR_21310 [Teladorsagia circumcincta]